jgi:hypothetical protein
MQDTANVSVVEIEGANLKKITVCNVFDLDEIALPHSSSIRLRVEIRRHDSGGYDAVIYRLETFRVVPTFDQKNSRRRVAADHEFLVIDDFFSQFSFTSSSLEETTKLVEAKIAEVFPGLGR